MGSNRLEWAAIAATLALVAGCNGQVVTENGAGGDGGGSAAGGDSDGVSATMTTTTATSTECVKQPTEPGQVPPQTCELLSPLIADSPVITDTGADGSLSPGETGTLWVNLVETSGTGMYSYPLIAFATDNPDMTVTNDDVLYGIGPCDVYQMTTLITVGAAVPKGTKVHVTAQVGALALDCPDSFKLTVPFTVQ